MCFCRAGMNHFATALLWGNNAELYCPKDCKVQSGFLCAGSQTGVCVVGEEVRGRYVNDTDGPEEGAANIFI